MLGQKTNDTFHYFIEKYYNRQGSPRKSHVDTHNLITVLAEIALATLSCSPDHKGIFHQHFFVNIKQVLEGNKVIVEDKMTFVAVHYGDSEGIAEPLPDLFPGKKITIRGKYIPSDEAYQTADNPGLPVLHFTHHPLGYIKYLGVKYE